MVNRVIKVLCPSSIKRGLRLTLGVTAALLASGLAAQLPPAGTIGSDDFAEAFAPTVKVTVGKALIIPMRGDIRRIAIGDPDVADYRIMPGQVYLLGKRPGDTNLIIWYANGSMETLNVRSSVSVVSLRNLISDTYPNESEIRVKASGSTIVLEGRVADTVVSDSIRRMAASYASTLNASLASARKSNANQEQGGAQATKRPADGDVTIGEVRVINLMGIKAPQQVQLEVRIAEVSRSYLEKIGFRLLNGISGSVGTSFTFLDKATGSMSSSATENASLSGRSRNSANRNSDSSTSSAISAQDSTSGPYSSSFSRLDNVASSISESSAFGNTSAGATSASSDFSRNGTSSLGSVSLGAQFSIEANRNRGAVRMLAEPTLVAMSGAEANFLVGGRVFLPTGRDNNGTVTLEAQNYGVGLTFQPTVLDNGRINLRVAPEVSSYLGGGTFSSTSTSTTVEIAEGESLIIGGLINRSSLRSGDSVPILGDIPIIGALFRSKAFQKNETELVVVVSPKLVASTKEPPPLPTDVDDTPSRADFFLFDKP